MLTAEEFQAWYAYLQLSKEAEAFIAQNQVFICRNGTLLISLSCVGELRDRMKPLTCDTARDERPEPAQELFYQPIER